MKKNTILSILNNNNDLITVLNNYKINENQKNEIYENSNYLIHDLPKKSWGGASIEGEQKIGLTWYRENCNYYLQIPYYQFATCHASTTGGYITMAIGKGIRLYNDDTFETQISNANDRKKRQIYEEKNLTKWNSDFTKSINNEQNLQINNKTNFVTNNVISL